MYNNAAASDFDDWNTPGWSFSELRPFIQKVLLINPVGLNSTYDYSLSGGMLKVILILCMGGTAECQYPGAGELEHSSTVCILKKTGIGQSTRNRILMHGEKLEVYHLRMT